MFLSSSLHLFIPKIEAAFVHLEEFMRHIVGRWGGPGAEGAVAKALRLGAGAGHG